MLCNHLFQFNLFCPQTQYKYIWDYNVNSQHSAIWVFKTSYKNIKIIGAQSLCFFFRYFAFNVHQNLLYLVI